LFSSRAAASPRQHSASGMIATYPQANFAAPETHMVIAVFAAPHGVPQVFAAPNIAQVSTHPGGAGGEAACARSAAASHLLDKTRLCKFFVAGTACRRGPACPFAHGRRQLRPRPNLLHTRLCRQFEEKGYCSFGAQCRYAHSEQEVRPPEILAGGRSAADAPRGRATGGHRSDGHHARREPEAITEAAPQASVGLKALPSQDAGGAPRPAAKCVPDWSSGSSSSDSSSSCWSSESDGGDDGVVGSSVSLGAAKPQHEEERAELSREFSANCSTKADGDSEHGAVLSESSAIASPELASSYNPSSAVSEVSGPASPKLPLKYLPDGHEDTEDDGADSSATSFLVVVRNTFLEVVRDWCASAAPTRSSSAPAVLSG